MSDRYIIHESRHTASSITDDALSELYDDLDSAYECIADLHTAAVGKERMPGPNGAVADVAAVRTQRNQARDLAAALEAETALLDRLGLTENGPLFVVCLDCDEPIAPAEAGDTLGSLLKAAQEHPCLDGGGDE